MSKSKQDGRLSGVLLDEISTSSNPQTSAPRDQQDGETSDCPLLTPSPPPDDNVNPLSRVPGFDNHDDMSSQMDQNIDNINSEDGLAFLNIVNRSLKPMHDSIFEEPSSRDPMVETSSSSGSDDTNEPVCTQLLTQLNTAYNHLAPDAQALFYNQENGGKPSLTGIQVVVPKSPKNYSFMSWNWPVIRKTFFWSLMSLFAGCVALAIGVIVTMPKSCSPSMEWWQGSLFYEIFPASYQDSYKNDGIGDLRGITNRLDYLKKLGVKGIRLNSVFRSSQYPQNYQEIQSLTEIDPSLGSLSDFTDMVTAIQTRNMKLVLDLPLYPYIKSLDDELTATKLQDNLILPSQRETRSAFRMAPARIPHTESKNKRFVQSSQDESEVTRAIRFWRDMGVDGFYLKGLEYFTDEPGFVAALRHWKSVLGPEGVFICSHRVLEVALTNDARNAILNRMDLVDVWLDATNSTKDIKAQVMSVLKGPLYGKPGYPWVHWSTGSVDSPRLASSLRQPNASVAVAMMGMMLPGTYSIFYGDEIGMLSSTTRQGSIQLNQLVSMRWNNQDGNKDETSVSPWMPESTRPAATNLYGLIPKMLKLRSETTPIYVRAVIKNQEVIPNADIRYTTDELMVIERWYPRRNTYVFLANLGTQTQTKDLSTLYYGGIVIVGSEDILNENIYFKKLTISPGEAFVIKLDK
ncbi:hypothetical protein QAD02_001093 [Eretmocerus hayati]|uniref:Uncharacterized protein n=1 Tax=Eretmocerus hayati TaxID=131215 RepID=A0ACC2NF29_9HYME|nr:hypothetical protein QAD02_001093 [Eretmocerus hayati]